MRRILHLTMMMMMMLGRRMLGCPSCGRCSRSFRRCTVTSTSGSGSWSACPASSWRVSASVAHSGWAPPVSVPSPGNWIDSIVLSWIFKDLSLLGRLHGAKVSRSRNFVLCKHSIWIAILIQMLGELRCYNVMGFAVYKLVHILDCDPDFIHNIFSVSLL